MNRALASFGVTLSAILAPAGLLVFAAIHAVLLAVSLANAGTASDQSFVSRGQVVGLLLWIPGLFVAARIRDAWPALGPGDAGLPWIRNQGVRIWRTLLGVVAAAAIVLCGLQCVSGVIAGLGLGAAGFRVTHRLALLHGAPVLLAKRGHSAVFTTPSVAGKPELVVEPTFLVGPREPLRVDVQLVQAGKRTPLAPLMWPDISGQARTRIPVPVTSGARIELTRAASNAPPILLAPGSVRLRGRRVATVWATTLIALRRLPWAVFLLAASLVLAGWIGPHLQTVAVLGIAPLLAALQLTGWDDAAGLLATAACPADSAPPLPLAVAMLASLALAVVSPRVVRRLVTES